MILYQGDSWKEYSMKKSHIDFYFQATSKSMRIGLRHTSGHIDTLHLFLILRRCLVERIPWYVGWGLRILPNRTLYFAIHHGRSVELERKSGYWKKIVLSVKDPEKFISILNERLRKGVD